MEKKFNLSGLLITFTICVFLYLSTCVICECLSKYIDYKNMESKRVIAFKIVDSNYVCEDMLKFAQENL